VVVGLFATLFGTDVVRTRGLTREVVTLLVFVSDISVHRVDPDKVRLRPTLSGTDRVVEDDGFDRREAREGAFLIGVVGDDVGVVLLSVVWLLFLTAGLAVSVATKRDFSEDTITEYLYALRGTSGESFVNMLRTEDTIPRLPRAVAELTRVRIGGELPFGGSLLVSGLSDDDFFIDGG
jgi:hypothetical protein